MLKYKYTKGFSLLEVVIACALGLLLMGGVVESFAMVNRVFQQLESVGLLVERGELIERLIRADIQMAGLNLCLVKRSVVNAIALERGIFSLIRYDEHAKDPCKAELINHQYYIKQNSNALYRKENQGKAVELAEGVSDFTVKLNSYRVVIDFVLHEKQFSLPWHIEEASRELL